MRKIILFFILLLSPASLMADEFCGQLTETLSKQLQMMNYCSEDSDCIKIDVPCPFGGALINKESKAENGIEIYNMQTGYVVSNGIELLRQCATENHLKCDIPFYSPPFKCVKNRCEDSRGKN